MADHRSLRPLERCVLRLVQDGVDDTEIARRFRPRTRVRRAGGCLCTPTAHGCQPELGGLRPVERRILKRRAGRGRSAPWPHHHRGHSDPRPLAGGGSAPGQRTTGHVYRRAGPRRPVAERPSTTSPGYRGGLAGRPLAPVASAEAQLAAGDARRALAVLTPEPRQARVEARVVAARARHTIGDRRGARALPGLGRGATPEAPLPAVVQLWSLDAELASESGDGERALALGQPRSARRPSRGASLGTLTGDTVASGCVNRHPDLSREHHAFLASVTAQGRCVRR